MQFETKIVNGKPSIFFKEESSSKTVSKRVTTKDKRAKQEIRKSLEVSGEVDMVKPSPRQIEQQQQHRFNKSQSNGAINSTLSKNGVNITQEQLDAIINAIKVAENGKSNSRGNKSLSSYEDYNNDNDEIKIFRPPQIVIASDNDDNFVETNKKFSAIKASEPINTNKSSLIDKKKLKWQQDLELSEKLGQQDHKYNSNQVTNRVDAHDFLPSSNNIFNNSNVVNSRPSAFTRTSEALSLETAGGAAMPFHKSTLTLAEKKRIQWQQEKANPEDYDKFRNNTNSNGNDIFNDLEVLKKSNSYNNLLANTNEQLNLNQKFQSTNDIPAQRNFLMEKKKEKWNQDKNNNDDHWPYGKPGPGAGAFVPADKNNRVVGLPPQPPQPPASSLYETNSKSKKYQEALDEFNRINQTVAAITEAENKIKSEKLKELQNNTIESIMGMANSEHTNGRNGHSDQSKLPAAMRTSILFGGVMYDEDIKKTKEVERKKWLQELEEQKKGKLIESQRQLSVNVNNNNNNMDLLNQYDLSPRELKHLKVTSMANQRASIVNAFESSIGKENKLDGVVEGEEKTFGRTRKLLDPAQLEEMEKKRKLALQHKREIDAQIAEKKRIQKLEEDIQFLNGLKVENEAKQISAANQLNQEIKHKQPQYQNFEQVLNSNRSNGVNGKKHESIATILQGDQTQLSNGNNKKIDKDDSNGNSETRAQEVFRKMQEAELAAAEEKHRKLLKRLQRGGHDTTQLERKFAELKAKLTGNPLIVDNNVSATNATKANTARFVNNNSNNNNNQMALIMGGGGGYETNRGQTAMSHLSEREQNLERQKQILESKLNKQHQEQHSNQYMQDNADNYELNNEQKSKIKQIFQMLREDTGEFPAELNEENLKILLKTVERNGNNKDSNKSKNNKQNQRSKSNDSNKKQQQQKEQQQEQQPNKQDGKKPIWNYKNLQGKKAKPNSMKDPFYNERAKLIEERRKRQLEHYQNLVDKNSSKYNAYMQSQLNDDQNDDFNDRNNNNQTKYGYAPSRQSSSSMSNYSIQTASNHNGQSDQKVNGKGQESIMNLLTKNLAKNTIYEEDEDQYLNMQKQKRNTNRNAILSTREDVDVGGNLGFVPFMRTNEFLDPAHAASPVPPSRESSAVKRDREKARQAYFQNMKPADYGSQFQTTYDAMNDLTSRNRKKDPLFNNSLVKNNPTPRQEQILSQLATLKQSLIQKQKEVASSINIDDDNNFYNLDD